MKISRPTAISGRALERSIRLGSFLLVLLSAIALMVTGRLHTSSGILMAAVLLAWFFGRVQRGGKIWEVASFLYLIFFFIDLFSLSNSLAPALVHLFIFILINKLFNLVTTRDYYQLYLLTFLSILAASSLNIEIEMFYLIFVYMVLLLWNVISMSIYKEWKKEGTTEFPFSLFRPIYWLSIIGTAIATFTLALAIFFVLPRLQLGYFSNLNSGKVQHVSGFSQKVSLGEIATIEEDTDVAMRVRVTSSLPIPLEKFYWRGMAFDHYDGNSWSTSSHATRFLHQDPFNNFYNTNTNDSYSELVKQELFMAPLDTRVIFGLDRIARIHGRFGSVTRDGNFNLMGMTIPEAYVVYSRISLPSHSRLRNASEELSEIVARYYLQLPDFSARIHTLAEQIVQDNETNYDRVLSVQRYLEENYAYSTTNLPQNIDDPVSDFLFETKSGHCEYFATSMVILLRHLGIPSRVVNGFLQGEYNQIGDFYIVRQSDAHSWVEVYFDGTWVPFDPSPRPLPGEGGSIVDYIRNLKKVADSVSFFWDRYILIFSAQDQLNILSVAREQLEQAKRNMGEEHGPKSLLRSVRDHLKRFWRLYVALTAAILFCFGYFFSRYRRSKKIMRTPILFYQEFLTILQRRGFVRSPETTPTEFVDSITTEVEPVYINDLRFLTDLFYRSRFGNYPLSEAEQLAIRTSLKHLQEMK